MNSPNDPAAFWDERYSGEDFHFGFEPNAFLKKEAGRIVHGGKVLLIADGEGRNGVYLAENGFLVTSTDISPRGIAKAKRLAQSRGVTLEWLELDVLDWNWPKGQYDAVVGIFVQFAPPEARARMFANMIDALKPGGVLLLQGYRPKQLEYATGGPSSAENMYTPELLREAFGDMAIELLECYDAEIHEGVGHSGLSALIDLVARKGAQA
jgi:SAM-dependent methyltransferase